MRANGSGSASIISNGFAKEPIDYTFTRYSPVQTVKYHIIRITLDVKHHTYFCLPNGNAVIDAGDRINSNRQSIIGHIELQPHKIRT
jgi:hypothetical protein